MVKQLLGGVALAATGYGLKRYFGEKSHKEDADVFMDADNTREVLAELEEVLNNYIEAKATLYNNTLRELKTALFEIKNLDKEFLLPNLDFIQKYDFKTVHSETLEYFEEFTQILQDAKLYIVRHLDKLDTIIISSNDFSTYSQEDKKFVENLTDLSIAIEKIDNYKMTYDKLTISREVKRGFGKVKAMVV